MNEKRWYVAKLKPGAGREARSRIGTPHHRHGENVAEQSIRDIGFDCYFPRMRREIVHHRTKKLVVRSFPLFTGYIFVAVPDNRFGLLHGLDGVGSLLGIDGVPFAVPAAIVTTFRDKELNLEFDDTRDARAHRGEIERTVSEEIRRRFRKGARVQVVTGPFSSFSAKVERVTSRDTIKAMVEIFGRLAPVEFEPEALQAA